MDLAPSSEQEMILDAVRGLAARVAPQAAAWDRADQIEPAVFEQLAELGLTGVFLDEAQGGSGFGTTTGLLAIEALAEASGALALRLASAAGAALPILAAAGMGHEGLTSLLGHSRYPALLEGVRRTSGGVDRRLLGEARWVVGGLGARSLVMTADDGEVFFVEEASVRGEPARGLGMRGAGLAHIRLEGFRVPTPLGRLPASETHHLAAQARLAVAAVGVGVGRAAVNEARNYALSRKQFGRPIGDFQAVQWMLADAATEVDAAGLLVRRGGLRLESGADGIEESEAALVLAAEAALSAAQKAIQVHGGYGFVREFPVERLARDARYFGLALAGKTGARGNLGRRVLELGPAAG